MEPNYRVGRRYFSSAYSPATLRGAPPLNIERRFLAYSKEPYQVQRKNKRYLRRKAWKENTPEAIQNIEWEEFLRQFAIYTAAGYLAYILRRSGLWDSEKA